MKFTKWEQDFVLGEFEREYDIHDIDNFLNKEEADKHIAKVKKLEIKIKKLFTEE